jgi:hypothetical protein
MATGTLLEPEWIISAATEVSWPNLATLPTRGIGCRFSACLKKIERLSTYSGIKENPPNLSERTREIKDYFVISDSCKTHLNK